MNYYTYAFLREDGTPYYIGKGKGRRCYRRDQRTISAPPTDDRIIKLKENLTEEQAFAHECYMIAVLPNLRNLTRGGEGVSGYKHTKESLRKMSEGNKKENFTAEQRKKWSLGQMGNTNCLGYKHTEEARANMSKAQEGNTNVRGMSWWNNGEVSRRAFECPGEGFIRGRLSKTNKVC
jgi:hypothetical protein